MVFFGSSVSSTNKTDSHDITEIFLKVALNTIKQTNKQTNVLIYKCTYMGYFWGKFGLVRYCVVGCG